MVSTPLLDSLRYDGYGAKLINPITNHSLHVPAFAFVDDTDLVHTIDPGALDYTKSTQHALHLWEEGLRKTGGALVPEKCMWYTIQHKWEKDKWRLRTMMECTRTLQLSNEAGTTDTVAQAEPHNVGKA
jgi:hypothetical protein